MGCLPLDSTNLTYIPNSGSPCRDQGAAVTRLDGTQVTTDIEGKPRNLGGKPDIGCYEKE